YVKFISAPEQQAAWYVGTGYFQVRRDAYQQPVAHQTLAQYPQFLTAISELRSSPVNLATQGGLLGVFPEARARSEDAIEATVLGKATAQASLANCANLVNASIATYNRTMGIK
ncbi:MAG TPA: ABC transporter substrate-binding protein, partial [bacterium]|nr:ABC transporter substrate-binding protein [bacterium]